MAVDQGKQGEVLRNQGNFVEAVACFSRAIEKTKDRSKAQERLAWLLAHRASAESELGLLDLAFADFERAFALRPEYPWANAHLGEAYRIQARDAHTTRAGEEQFRTTIEQSFSQFRQALKLDKDYCWAHAHLAAAGVLCFWYYQLYLGLEIPKKLVEAFAGEPGADFVAQVDAEFARARKLDAGNSWNESFDALWSTLCRKFDRASARASAALLAGADRYPLQRALALTALYTAREPGGAHAESIALTRANQLLLEDPEDTTAHLVRAVIYKHHQDDPIRRGAFEFSKTSLRVVYQRLGHYLRYLEQEGDVRGGEADLETAFVLSRLGGGN